jgi:hypothetical protein
LSGRYTQFVGPAGVIENGAKNGTFEGTYPFIHCCYTAESCPPGSGRLAGPTPHTMAEDAGLLHIIQSVARPSILIAKDQEVSLRLRIPDKPPKRTHPKHSIHCAN